MTENLHKGILQWLANQAVESGFFYQIVAYSTIRGKRLQKKEGFQKFLSTFELHPNLFWKVSLT